MMTRTTPLGRRFAAALGSAAVLAALASVPAPAAASESAYYYVSVFTGKDEDAGTNGDVFITLNGTSGSFGPFELDTKDYDDFERGENQTYLVTTPSDLGRITSIKLKMDDDDGWKPAVVYVSGPNLRTTRTDGKTWRREDVIYRGNRRSQLDFYRFPPGNPDLWLDSDDKITEVTFARVNNYQNDRTISDTDKNGRVVEAMRNRNNINIVPAGYWRPVSSGSQQVTTSIKRGYSFSSGKDSKDIKSLSASLGASVTAGMTVGAKAGAGYGPVSAEASTEASVSTTANASTTAETASEISSHSSRSDSAEETCGTANIFATDDTVTVHQWVVSTDLTGKKDIVTFGTCRIACTVEGRKTGGKLEIDLLAAANPADLKGLNCNRFRKRD